MKHTLGYYYSAWPPGEVYRDTVFLLRDGATTTWFRNMRIRSIGFTLLLMIGVTNAFAEPGGGGRGPKDNVRTFYIQSATLDRNPPRGPQPGQQAQDQSRHNRESSPPESSGYGAQRESHANSSSDNARRQGRMSPEERRTLRRQIDEVGHDIYAPRR